MKARGFLLLMLFVQSCFYHPYFKNKESEWWYLEDWDTNKDMVIDKNEFTRAFGKNKQPELAEAAFAKADYNKDGKLNGLEFYEWETNL